ncbi:TetR/AcrR family transcriptional regulator C-terminal domain-containing protein [Nonomuraea sp. NPDC050451]|uniref:TetR/AcrR family transcriptional regulator C-terminal domain-containing protein n=1 Tax=Nonomuraea sp. NPDC050451 TaxID=3364364 RepID=UPI00379A100F
MTLQQRKTLVSLLETLIGIVDRHLRKVIELESDLVEFGVDMVTPVPQDAVHFALVRQIDAEAGHIPLAAIEAWQQAGPLRVRHALADRLQQAADKGLLTVSDPLLAAHHLLALLSSAAPSPHAPAGDR